MSWQSQRKHSIFLILLMFGGLVSCGTFEVGVEGQDEVGEARLIPIISINSPNEGLTAEAETAVPLQAPDDVNSPKESSSPTLRVVYTKDNNVWIWSQKSGAVKLTNEGGVEEVYLSDDGERIAYLKNDSIWVVNSDGSETRLAVTKDAMSAMVPDAVNVNPYQISWLPGSHTLLFNTVPQYREPGLYPNNDLWAVDVDDLTLVPLLPAGEGGNFVVSPDGRLITIITSGGIDIIAADGSERQTVFTYTPVLTYNETQYYARPVWSSDSTVLYVAIPPADSLAASQQPTTIWKVFINGNRARFLGNIPAALSLRSDPLFTPDLSRVAYLMNGAQQSLRVAISELNNGVSAGVVYPVQAEALKSWSPTGTYFVFTPSFSTIPTRQIGVPGMDPILLADEGTAVLDVEWISDNQYLYLRQNDRSWDILLAQIGNETPLVLDTVSGPPPTYAFDN